MKFAKTMSALALGSVGLMGAMRAHAAWNLNAGDTLSITAGTTAFDANDAPYITNGSFFAVDADKDSNILGVEKIALSQGSTGITIGASNTAPDEVTATWSFLGNPGYDWISTPVTGGTAGLDMSGWRVSWNYGNQVVLDTGAWQIMNASSGMPTSGYSNGTGIFDWSGIYGDAYTLDYTATVQSGPFNGVQWAIHLEGVVAVPEASTYGMMLAGLGLVGAAARRRKQSTILG